MCDCEKKKILKRFFFLHNKPVNFYLKAKIKNASHFERLSDSKRSGRENCLKSDVYGLVFLIFLKIFTLNQLIIVMTGHLNLIFTDSKNTVLKMHSDYKDLFSRF